MKALMQELRENALQSINQAENMEALEALRVKYLGKKGELTAILKQMGKLSAEERPVMGQLANQIRAEIEKKIDDTRAELEAKALEARLKKEALDVTIPGEEMKLGHKHPMYMALDEIKDIFVGMGFTVLDGPEVELATYNFDKLNAEEGHPSRDWSDTFYFTEDSSIMLRSQTSPMQVRVRRVQIPSRGNIRALRIEREAHPYLVTDGFSAERTEFERNLVLDLHTGLTLNVTPKLPHFYENSNTFTRKNMWQKSVI